MDPDLVRQQAEAELEHRVRATVMAKKPWPKKRPAMRAAKSDVAEQATIRTVIYTPVADTADRAKPIKPSRWHVHMQTLFSSSALACMAGLAAAAWGADQGLSVDGQLWLGSGAAALMALVYGGLFSLRGSNFMPAGRRR